MCFLGKINLMGILQLEGDAKYMEAVNADRQCDSWHPYMPGLSPKEHYDEVLMQRLEADRRAYEERTEESRRRYEAGMAKDSEADRRSFELSNQERNTALIKASIIVAVTIGAAQILSAFITASLTIIAAFLLNRESLADHLLRTLGAVPK
jgi:hypothetical protein